MKRMRSHVKRKRKVKTLAQRSREILKDLEKKDKKGFYDYSVIKAFEELPKYMKEGIDIQRAAALISKDIQLGYNIDKNTGEVKKAKEIVRSYAGAVYRRTGKGTLRDVYKRFRNESSNVYSKYNTYIYRLGYSASQYFYENAEISQEGSLISIVVGLPEKEGISYSILLIEYDYSGGEFVANMY